VEYDGTSYHGWQLQKNVPTVQGSIEKVLGKILGAPTRVHGAGRTDAGVHAQGQVAHFLSNWARSLVELQRACNALLPPDISIAELTQAPDGFHARHSARAKRYVYTIRNAPLRSPLRRLYCLHVASRLDVSLMQEAAEHLLGSHDFAAFGSPTDGTPSTVREMWEARFESGEQGDTWHFVICGSGFLRYMVRSIVGTLLWTGTGKIRPEEFRLVLESRDRSRSGPTAPPHGLCLVSVEYGVGDATES
jgi:tRNA pseudouridine38-40 synthase